MSDPTTGDETDLDALTSELASVVQDTMQPERVSVWLAAQSALSRAGDLTQQRPVR